MNSIADEIDFSPYLLWNIIMPLMTEKRHKLFAVSSVKPGGGFSAIVSAADERTGEPLMHSVVLGKACEACAHSDAPYMCTHNDNLTADWKDPRRSQRVAKVYRACGKTGALMSELFSSVGSGEGAAFERAMYSDLFLARPPHLEDPIEVVYLAVDPAFRGPCEFAITAVGQTNGKFKYQIIAMCSEVVFGDETRVDNVIYKSLKAIKDHPRVSPHAPVIVAIEGMAADAMYLGPKFRQIASELSINMCVLREMKAGPNGQGFGTPKNATVTAGFIAVMSGVLSRKLMALPDDCAAVSSDAAVPPQTFDDQRFKLREQFVSFKANMDGSINGKSGGKNDDLIVTLLMCVFWSQIFCRSTAQEYDEFKASFPHLTTTWANGAACYFDTKERREQNSPPPSLKPKL